MKLELVDLKHLPNTNVLDGTPIYTHPIRLIRTFFLKRIELCTRFLETEKGNVLDIGCGSGVLLPTLSKIDGVIVGIDIHKNLSRVNNYLKNNRFQNIHLIRADCHFLPFKKSSFNYIMAISLLDHLKKPRMAVQEIYQIAFWGSIIIFGLHTTKKLYYLTGLIWNIIWIISYLISFRNIISTIKTLFTPRDWRHKFSDSILIHWISEQFNLKRQFSFKIGQPVYVAIKSMKEKR